MSYPPPSHDPLLPAAPEPKVSTEMIAAILKVRRAPVCIVCGNAKDVNVWFCKTCYFALPGGLKTHMWRCHTASDQEMRDYFLQAVDYLVKQGKRFMPRQKMPMEAQQIIHETGFSPALTQYLFESRGAVSAPSRPQRHESRPSETPEGTKTEPL